MMPRYMLDTNAVSDLMRDHPRMTANVSAHSGQIFSSATVRGEIREGIVSLPLGKRRHDLEAKAKRVFAALPSEPIAAWVGDIFADIKVELRKLGSNLEDNDIWIAATALSLGATLVTRDADFGDIPTLPVEDWTV